MTTQPVIDAKTERPARLGEHPASIAVALSRLQWLAEIAGPKIVDAIRFDLEAVDATMWALADWAEAELGLDKEAGS